MLEAALPIRAQQLLYAYAECGEGEPVPNTAFLNASAKEKTSVNVYTLQNTLIVKRLIFRNRRDHTIIINWARIEKLAEMSRL